MERPSFLRRYSAVLAAGAIVAVAVATMVCGKSIPLRAVGATLRHFPVWAVAAALGLGLLQNLLQCTRLWTLLPGDRRLPWSRVFRSFAWGQLVNNYVPARAGDVVKIALIRGVAASQPDGDAPDASAASLAGSVLLADKVVDIGALLLVLAGLAPTLLRRVHVPHAAASPILWGAVAAIVVALFALRRRLGGASRVLGEVLRGSSALWKPRQLLLALALGAGAWLSEAAMLMALARAAGSPLSVPAAVGVLVVLNVGIAVPVSFANIGTFEAAAAFGLTRAGVPVTQALAIALLHHAIQVACVVLSAALGSLMARAPAATPFRVRAVDKHRALQHYDGASSSYDDSVARGPLKLLRAREHNAILGFARFDDPATRTVIDVGCGGGVYVLAAKRAGLRVTAVDLAPGMIERLRDHADEAWVGDVEELDHDRTYDIVICAGVLDFVLDPERAFKNLAALTAPGGRLVVLAPRVAAAGFIYRVEKKLMKIEVNLYSLDWFRKQAGKWGLRVARYVHPLPTNRVLLFERPR